MSTLTPVPWISWDEWNFVRESLFSSSPDCLNTALQTLAVWRIRGFVPVVIDVTAAIIETHQIDPKFRKGDHVISNTLISSSYLTAILRLVNGLIDPYRNSKGKRQLSISQAAEELGLPRMLIDIRHEGSHRILPSLNLLREASVKALEWIKSNYWEPQRKAIPFQRDKIELVRKETNSKLHELAFQLNMKQRSRIGSLSMKRKLEYQEGKKAEKSQPVEKKRKQCGTSPQGGCINSDTEYLDSPAPLVSCSTRKPSRVVTGIVRSLFRLYSSHPSEFVDVLLDVLQKALDSPGSNGVENNSGTDDPLCENSETQTGVLDLCKLLITKFLYKEPKLLLIMLRVVLETLETRERVNIENGKYHLTFSQSKAETRQVEQLSSLVMWIIERYNELRQEVGGDDKVALEEILKKCLVLSYPGNASSALLVAQMIGNDATIGRVKKLFVLRSAKLDSGDEKLTCTGSDRVSRQQEVSINEAEEMVGFLKWRQNKDNAIVVASDGEARTNDQWRSAKSWNLLPFGAVLGPTDVVPVLDKVINIPGGEEEASQGKKWELKCCCGSKRGILLDAEALEDINDNEGMEVDDGQAHDHDFALDLLKGRLMIGGIYRQVHTEESHAIESAVRILV